MTLDRNVTPKYDVPMWNETRWNHVWNPDQGVGLYLHMGRWRQNLDLWWCQTVVYLPDNQLVVHRSWAPSTNEIGLTHGGFDLSMTEDGWTSTMDGAGQLTNYDELVRAPRGDSYPCVPVQWSVTATPAAPVLNPYSAGTDGILDFAGDAHVQQSCYTTGTLTVAGTEYSLDGVGWKDHSSGVRDFTAWRSHHVTMIITDDFVVHAASLASTDGDPSRATTFGRCYRDGTESGIERVQMTPATDRFVLPDPGVEVEIVVEGGEKLPIVSSEIVHMLPMTISVENENGNGIDWEAPGNPVVLMEGVARYTLENGGVGYGFYETSARRDAVKRP